MVAEWVALKALASAGLSVVPMVVEMDAVWVVWLAGQSAEKWAATMADAKVVCSDVSMAVMLVAYTVGSLVA